MAFDCGSLPAGYHRDACRGHDDDGNPTGIPEDVRQEMISDWVGDELRMKHFETPAAVITRDPLDDSLFLDDLPCMERSKSAEVRESTRCGSRGREFNVYQCGIHGECTAVYQCVDLMHCTRCEHV